MKGHNGQVKTEAKTAAAADRKSSSGSGAKQLKLKDNRQEALAQKTVQVKADNSIQAQRTSQLQALMSGGHESAGVVQGVFTKHRYRIADGVSREIYIQRGLDNVASMPAAPAATPPAGSRAVLHETMAHSSDGPTLAARFSGATAAFRTNAGLSVAINAPFRKGDKIADKQSALNTTAAGMVRGSASPINVVAVLWEDGRADPKTEGIRGEVPFAELRRAAATDPNSRALYTYLKSQAATVWRKMGDEDMPFPDPNAAGEVSTALAKAEADTKKLGHMVTFNYRLTASTATGEAKKIIDAIYKYEGRVIAEIRKEYSIPSYAIEPTTYYMSSPDLDRDPGEDWARYEGHADSKNKQIKEGASFAKAFHVGSYRHSEHHYVPMNDPMPTDHGGRLNELIPILRTALDTSQPFVRATFETELRRVLPAIDQSIWDGETIIRGARWMGADETYISSIEGKIKDLCARRLTNLVTLIANQVVVLRTPAPAPAPAPATATPTAAAATGTTTGGTSSTGGTTTGGAG